MRTESKIFVQLNFSCLGCRKGYLVGGAKFWCAPTILKPCPLISEKLAFGCALFFKTKQKSQRETPIGTILQVKLKDKDYEKTKSTLYIKWLLVLIRVPI